MASAAIALLGGAAIWLFALSTSHREHPATRSLEFWWASAAFFTSGVGTLVTFNFLTLSANEVVLARAIPMAALGALLVTGALVRGGVKLGHGAIPLVLLFALFGIFAVTGQSALMPLASLATLLPAIIVPARGFSYQALRAGARAGVGAVLAVVALLYAWRPNDVIGACRLDKCSEWGLALGAEGTGNAMGMYFAGAGALSLLLVDRVRERLGVLVGALVLVDLTASRSALFSFGAAALVVIVGQALTRRSPRRRWSAMGLAASAAVVVGFPLVVTDPSSYTGRAELWMYSRELFWRSPLAGHGPSFWVSGNGSDGIDRNYSTHNLFTELLVSGGALAVLAFAFAIVGAIRGPRTLPAATHAIAAASIVMLVSLSEVTSAPGRIYLAPCFVAYLFMVGQSDQGNADDEDLGAANRRSTRSRRHERRVATRGGLRPGLGASPELRSTRRGQTV